MRMGVARLSASLRRHGGACALLLICSFGGWAQAQSASTVADPPDRVARLSYVSGDVGLLPSGASAWGDASLNRPLTNGDRLSTSAGARAELELGGSNLQLDGGANVGVLDLNDQVAQIELTQGTLNVSVRTLDAGQSIEIDTPTVALVIDRPGSFRVDVGRGDRPTRISVRDGRATVYGEDQAQRSVNAGRSYQFADSAMTGVAVSQITGDDAFDAWVADRSRRYARSDTRRYVSDQVVGYQDLDQYGDWQTDNDYGAVWYPSSVAADWAPYRQGHWAYIAPWGWSWVDDAAWGFAPYHYGRWTHLRGRWGWVPGPRDIRPVYAPALVAFVGGGGWSVGVGSGPVGWFPLGPGEFYNPWYRSSRNYYTNVNITNIYVRRGYDRGRYGRDLDHHYNRYRQGLPVRAESYVNRDAPRGLTAVSGKTFVDGGRVRGNMQRVERRELATATVLPRGIPARPATGATVLPRGAHARSLPIDGFDRSVVARRAPPPARVERVQPVSGVRGGSVPATAPARVRVLDEGVNGPDRRRATFDRADVQQRQANRTRVLDREAASVRATPANVRSFGRSADRLEADRVEADGVDAAAPAGVVPADRVDRHDGALPSARFVRSQRIVPADVESEGRVNGAVRARERRGSRASGEDAPRPGLSVVSGAASDRAAALRASGRDEPRALLQPQRQRFQTSAVENATPKQNQPSADWDERRAAMREAASAREAVSRRPTFASPAAQRAESYRAMPQQQVERMPAREPQPYQRQMRSMDASPRPSYAPQRESAPAPAAMQQPRMAAPPPQAQSAPPARSEGKQTPARSRDDRYQRVDQQN